MLARSVNGQGAREWPPDIAVSTRSLFGYRVLSCCLMVAQKSGVANATTTVASPYGNGHREVRYMQEHCAGAQYASTTDLVTVSNVRLAQGSTTVAASRCSSIVAAILVSPLRVARADHLGKPLGEKLAVL